MSRVRIICLSHKEFDKRMREMGLDSSNVGEHKDKVFISIIGTKECLEHYLREDDTTHYFSNGTDNVLNLDFDDLDRDFVYNGYKFKAMTMKQAEESIDFIERTIGVSEYYVHCRAGVSRSRAFCEMISRILEENGVDFEYEDRDKYSNRLNSGVLRRLTHAYWKKHKSYFYADDDSYPEGLT